MTDFADQKLDFIHEVAAMQDVETFSKLVAAYQEIKQQSENVRKYHRPIPKKFDADAVRRSRGYRRPDREKIMQLIQQMDVQEPIELLLSQLTK